MNQSEYNDALRKDSQRRLDGKAPKVTVIDIPVNSIETNDEEGGTQCRAGGFVQSNITNIAVSIEAKGQRTPITVENRNGKYFAVDGNHRLKALRSLVKQHAGTDEEMEYHMVKAVVKQFASPIERIKYKTAQNEHFPHRGNDKNDVYNTIIELRAAGDASVPLVPQPQKYALYEKAMRAYLKKEYTLSPGDTTQVVKLLTKDLPHQKLRNIEKDVLEDEFVLWDTKLHWEGREDNKDGIAGWNVYTAAKAGGSYPNKSIMSYCFKAKSQADEGEVKNAIIVWDNNTLGRNEKQIDEYRQSVVEAFNTLNSSHMLKKGATVVDKIYIAPQKTSKAVTEKGFFEVRKDKQNKFITKGRGGIPKTGWSILSS